MRVAVAGIGMTPFARQPERTLEDLGHDAVMRAVRSAGIGPGDIGVTYVGSVYGPVGVGQRILRDLGLTGRPVFNLENACASGADAVIHAALAVERGAARYALALGVESPSRTFAGGLLPVDGAEHAAQVGMTLPALYAMRAREHMRHHGTTAEQLAMVSVKNRANGVHNPAAAFRTTVDIDEVLAGPLVADPLTRLQCCPTADGAAAVVLGLATGGLAHLVGYGVQSGRLKDRAEVTDTLTARTAAEAFERVGFGPEDLDLCEVHDAFTIGELLAIEGLGLCPAGDGGKYVESRSAHIGGGATAVNPSGGLLARGHPLGATGVAQVIEAAQQLTGHAGGRQVENARTAICHTRGGSIFDLEANSCDVLVLTR